MPIYRTTLRNLFRTPSGAVGEAPDGPGAMAALADDVEAYLGIGGAEYAANYAAITAIPAARTFPGKRAYAADTGILYRVSTSNNWRIAQPHIQITQAQRLALPTAACVEGQEVTEHDTSWKYRWTGGAWVPWDSPWVRVTDGTTTPAYPTGYAAGGGGSVPAMRRIAGEIELRGTFQKTAGGNMVQGESYWTLPTNWRPPATVYQFANGSGLQYGALMIDAAGVFGNYSLKGTTPTWWSLDNWRFAPA